MLNIFNKWVVGAIYVMLFISLLNGCNGCANNKATTKLRKDVDSLTSTINDLKVKMYSKEELDIRLEILALEEEKSVLYNVNYIVLTKERPDTRMNQIDEKIKALREKIRK